MGRGRTKGQDSRDIHLTDGMDVDIPTERTLTERTLTSVPPPSAVRPPRRLGMIGITRMPLSQGK